MLLYDSTTVHKYAMNGLLALLGCAALISLAQGFLNAQIHSQDFQWSPSVLFWSGENPYLHYLQGNAEGTLILSQMPNYLHQLYIVLGPLAAKDFETAKVLWAICNILFAFFSVILIRKIYSLTIYQTLFLTSVFFMSTPLRNAIGNGQQSLIILCAFLCSWYFRNPYRGLFLSVGFTKYSFAPFFFLHALFRHDYRSLVISLIMLLISAIVFGTWVNELHFGLLFQPLIVAFDGVQPGIADMMSVIRRDFGIHVAIAAISSVSAALLISWYVRKSANGWTLAILCLSSLAFIQHLIYDYVFLLPVFGFLLSKKSPAGVLWKTAVAATIFYFFFFIKLNADVLQIIGESAVRWAGFGLMILSIILLIYLQSDTGSRVEKKVALR